MATQRVTQTVTRTTTTTTRRRGLAAVGNQPKRKPGRPKGSKDTKPRKTRSDKGKKRGSYKKRANATRA